MSINEVFMDEIKDILSKDFGPRSAQTYYSTPKNYRSIALQILQNQEIRQFDHYPTALKINDSVRRGRDWNISDNSDVNLKQGSMLW